MTACIPCDFRRSPSAVQKRVDETSEGAREILQDAVSKKKGVVYVTAHIGNWELMAAWEIADDLKVVKMDGENINLGSGIIEVEKGVLVYRCKTEYCDKYLVNIENNWYYFDADILRSNTNDLQGNAMYAFKSAEAKMEISEKAG